MVTITDSDKVDHFVAQMYLCDIFEYKFLDDWEEAMDMGCYQTTFCDAVQQGAAQART